MPETNRAIAGAANPAGDRPPVPAHPAEINGSLLTVSEECVGRRAVLSVTGEVDISNAKDLGAAIESTAARASELWLDLSALTFMDSSGLNALADTRVRLIEANVRLTLICPEGPVRRVLALAGFDRIFEIHATRSAADLSTPA